MQSGLLWHDSSANALSLKIGRAIERYRERFGAAPNVCYVHPQQLPEGEQRIGEVAVRASERVLLHHFWVGQEQPQG
ncbi:MAG TPA: hypothetical protein ENN14_00955 [Chloroflexi bacterium]|mgnify:CR=1 FL=1|nr:hypothetical protein [Chloroflexota bacterium]